MSKLIPSITPLRTFEGHEESVIAVAVFPDRRRMVTGSFNKTLHLWDLKTGVVLKKMEGHRNEVSALMVSRDGQMIASSDYFGEVIVWHGETGETLTQPIKAHFSDINSLDFCADGTVLATAGSGDKTVKLWCTKTWQQKGNKIELNSWVNCVRYSPSGELLAIATSGNIEIYNSSTRERVATQLEDFDHNSSLAWTPDGTRLLSGGNSNDIIHEWDTSTWKKVSDPWQGHTGYIKAIAVNPAGTLLASTSRDNHVRLWRLSDRQTIATFQHSSDLTCVTFSVDGKHVFSGGNDNKISEWEVPKGVHSKILTITAAYHSCITGDLPTAEQLLTQEIDTDANNYTSYAHRSFVMARKQDWDHALEDAIKSISIQPSLIGYISKGISLCGQGHVRDARVAFDIASVFTNQDSETVHFLLLIKAIALFNADQHEEAMLLLRELTAACPRADTRACHVVKAYLRVQLGIRALDGARHDEAADHFTAAVNSSTFSSKFIHEIYEDFVVLFGWDLESFWLSTHQKRCQAFLSAGKVAEALESHKYMMGSIDETTKASCFDWSTEFKEQCSSQAAHDDRILGAEIPGQDHDGYDAEPDFFRGMRDHPQTSRPRPQRRMGRFKKLGLAMTRSPHTTPAPAPPTTLSSTTAPTTFKAHIRHIFTWRPDHAAPPVVDVPFAKAKERNAAADAPGKDEDLVPDEYFDNLPQGSNTQQPDTQQQQQPVAEQGDTGEHGGGKSCFCC